MTTVILQPLLPDFPSLRKAASVYSDAKTLPHDLPDNVNDKAREAAERALRTYSLEGAAEGKASDNVNDKAREAAERALRLYPLEGEADGKASVTLRVRASLSAGIEAHEQYRMPSPSQMKSYFI